MDSAKKEKTVDVFQVVKTLRKERLRMFSSLVGTRNQSVSLLQLKTEKVYFGSAH